MKNLANNLTRTFCKWNMPILAIAVALGIVMYCSIALAQSGAGSIQGTVTDTTGAVIPGASINVVQLSTNATFNTRSNGVGFYQVPSLFTGTYVVTISAPGMKTYKTTIEVLVDQHAVINPTMTAGAITQQVEVAADTVQLTTTDNGTIASTLENTRINQLPMNGRVLYTLAGMTTPGLESSGQRANGLLQQALEYVADGVPLTNRQLGSLTQANLPDPDSVQEVRIETTNTSALYTTPGTVVITTKSGTNSLHGTMFETARNNGIGNARPRTVNYILPHLVRNEYGASAGGPIILPHVYHGRDKSFWFFAYERYSQAQSTPENVTVPTTAMRGGDYSGLINGSGTLQVLFDPATTTNSASCLNPVTNTSAPNPYCRTQFNYNGKLNAINPARMSPTSKIIYDITAAPGTSDNPLVTPNLAAPDPNNQQIPTITFRFDHTFNENNRGYLRFTDNLQTQFTLRNYPNNSPATIAADGFPNQASGIAYNPIATYAVALGFTHVFSPTFFAETVLSQQWYNQRNFAGGKPFTNFEKMLGTPNNFGEVGFPNFGSTLICPYGGTQFVYDASQITSNLDENLTKTVGKNQMQFGGRYRHERMGTLPDMANDTVSFGAYATALENPATGTNYGTLPNTGYADGDMYLGAASSYGVNLSPAYAHMHDMEFDAYFQDNYHASRNLTVNLGLRYEAHPAPWEKYGQVDAFDLKNDAQVLAVPPATLIAEGLTTQAIITNLQNIGVVFETPMQAGYPAMMIKNYNLTFSPRVGLAYTPFNGKYGTVIRGAYGRYTFPIPTRNSVKNLLQNQPFQDGYSQSYTSAAQSPDGASNYLVRTNTLPVILGVNSSNVVNTNSINSILPGSTLWTFAPNYAPTFVTEVNATVEQPLKGNSALRLTWSWAHAANLDHPYYYNTHPSTFTWEMQTGIVPPTGGASVIGTPQQNTYASTAQGPYDQTKYSGSNLWQAKDGWSNDNALQVNYQRLFHRGVAYQVSYVWSKPMRLGGNSSRDGLVYTAAAYLGGMGTVTTMTSAYPITAPNLPPARPFGIAPYADWKKLAKYEQYILDSAIPLHHITFNGIVDMPFGTGKRFLGNSNRFMNEVVGGWQIAGDGSIATQDFQPTATNWGPTNPIKVYKHNARITDCRSGVCHESFEWFNGYIAPTVNASVACTTNCVSGLPSNWTPYQTPIDTVPSSGANYNTNNVVVNLTNGTPNTTGYAPYPSGASGPATANPFSHTFLMGPTNWTIDASVFKVFPITERMNLRFNMDVFNALNMQGYLNPSSADGTESLLSSANSPRQVQLTLRLTF
jgi:hypothetical protein